MVAPLTAEDKKSIDKALSMIADAEKEIARAKVAKIDVSAHEAEMARLKDRLLSIKQAYFPGGRA
jgi:hypothetical protein